MGVEGTYAKDENTWLVFDSAMTDEEVFGGRDDIPQETIETLMVVPVRYLSFDDHVHQGQIVVHESLAQ